MSTLPFTSRNPAAEPPDPIAVAQVTAYARRVTGSLHCLERELLSLSALGVEFDTTDLSHQIRAVSQRLAERLTGLLEEAEQKVKAAKAAKKAINPTEQANRIARQGLGVLRPV